MGWLDRDRIPLYHVTANHTVYDAMSERVFADVMAHLPANGPADQIGLSYWVRRGDLLMVFVNTMTLALGGEGHVETEWLAATLAAQNDARVKLVVGHHPVFPVNGFEAPFQREVGPPHGAALWDLLVEHRVLAYVCSHILAFDVQVHRGVLQITTAGAGTAHRMPEGVEYLHAVQAVIDDDGLRYQVLDADGHRREGLRWPPDLPPVSGWAELSDGTGDGAPPAHGPLDAAIRAWRVVGRTGGSAGSQTLIEGSGEGAALAPIWVGLTGGDQRLTIVRGSAPGRSPIMWFGPSLGSERPLDLQIALHGGMGPGGLLWRPGEDTPWSSMRGASATGVEGLGPVRRWSIGEGAGGSDDRPFRGQDLRVWTTHALQGEL